MIHKRKTNLPAEWDQFRGSCHKPGNERFFEFIMDKLKQLYPKRDYNRAIEIPTEFDVEHEKPLKKINEKVKEIINEESDKVKNELEEVEGFIDVKEKDEEIKKRLREVIVNNKDYKDFTKKLNKLVNSHPFFKKEKKV